ncbi:Meiotic recombination protein rec12 like [Verticillium longisporum]|uniref:Meiotic recombination protein rec12 like n=2 Tax=Verticillium longisporum TaxID=100787 RepID=A0A8I2ZW00_VERLO|nr:Meiotic recombination protein rec12 like [Verticillium longisporum]
MTSTLLVLNSASALARNAHLIQVAAGKGLASGPVKMHLQNGTQVDMSSGSTGVLIPSVRDVVGMNFASTKWVLVIEKEAAFRPLAVQQYWGKSGAGHGVIVTGKGYPDLVTRSFLHAIQAMKPDMPIFCLVDFDPDGLRIMQCYKHGSQSLSHESYVVLPRLQWLGIRSADLMADGQRGADGDRVGVPRELPADPAAVMPLSLRDRSCAQRLLASYNEDDADVDDSEYRRELQIMLVLGVKGEIQAVDDVGNLTRWLDRRLLCALGGLEL